MGWTEFERHAGVPVSKHESMMMMMMMMICEMHHDASRPEKALRRMYINKAQSPL